jgi:hypothetical protein
VIHHLKCPDLVNAIPEMLFKCEIAGEVLKSFFGP